MDMRSFRRSRAGAAALDMLSDWCPPTTDAWAPVILETNAAAACADAQAYRPEFDWNDGLRCAYLKGRDSRRDVKAAAWTVLDHLGLYGTEASAALARAADPERLGDDPTGTLRHGLLALLQSLEHMEPTDFTPEQAPHHYQLGPLLLGSPITATRHKGDAQWLGCAWHLEALFRHAMASELAKVKLEPGDTMPRGLHAYPITAAFMAATVDPDATAKRVRDRLGKWLNDYADAAWAGWPTPIRQLQPRRTSEIRTRRKADDDLPKNRR